MRMDIITARLVAACEKPGCVVCRLCQEDEIASFTTLLADYVNDGLTRLGLVRSRGLCAEHAWMLQARALRDWGDGLKPSILYESVGVAVEAILDAFRERPSRMDAASPNEGKPLRRSEWLPPWQWRPWGHVSRSSSRLGASRLLRRLAPVAICPICEAMRRKERLYVSNLAEAHDEAFWQAYRRSEGVCMPHLRQVLAQTPDDGSTSLLTQVARDRLHLLLVNMRGAMDKRRKSGAPAVTPYEDVAWIRLVSFFGGEARDDGTTDAVLTMRALAMWQYFQGTRGSRPTAGEVQRSAR